MVLWDLASAAYTGVTIAEVNNPSGLWLQASGSRLFVAYDISTLDEVSVYKLAAPFSLAGAVKVGGFSTESANTRGVFVSASGADVYTAEPTNNFVRHYKLSTPWSLATATLNYSLSVPAGLRNIYIQDSGAIMYQLVSTNTSPPRIVQWDMTSAFSLATATLNQYSYALLSTNDLIRGMWFQSSGSYIFLASSEDKDVLKYKMSTPWSLATAAFHSSFAIEGQTSSPSSITFQESGAYFYISDFGGVDDIYEYKISWHDVVPVGAASNALINIGDSWKNINTSFINIGDSWKKIDHISINIGDTWKTIT